MQILAFFCSREEDVSERIEREKEKERERSTGLFVRLRTPRLLGRGSPTNYIYPFVAVDETPPVRCVLCAAQPLISGNNLGSLLTTHKPSPD